MGYRYLRYVFNNQILNFDWIRAKLSFAAEICVNQVLKSPWIPAISERMLSLFVRMTQGIINFVGGGSWRTGTDSNSDLKVSTSPATSYKMAQIKSPHYDTLCHFKQP